MRTVFSHAVNVLRRHTDRHEALSSLLRDRGSRHVEHPDLSELIHSALLQSVQQIHCMGRHAHHIGRTGLENPVESRPSKPWVMNDEFAATNHRLLKCDGTDMVAHRTKAQEDCAVIVRPVRDHGPAIRQQRIVAMHHPLGRPGRPTGKCKVDKLVGISDRRSDWRSVRMSVRFNGRRDSRCNLSAPGPSGFGQSRQRWKRHNPQWQVP